MGSPFAPRKCKRINHVFNSIGQVKYPPVCWDYVVNELVNLRFGVQDKNRASELYQLAVKYLLRCGDPATLRFFQLNEVHVDVPREYNEPVRRAIGAGKLQLVRLAADF